MVYGSVFRLIVLVELGIHCILCFDSVVQQSNNFGIAWNFIYWICFVFNFNIAFWVQRFSFSLQCYGLWLTQCFWFWIRDLRFGISNRSCSFPSHPPKISFIRFQCFVFHFVSYSDPAMSRIEIRRGEGEERKGKERKGKERKGKERKGKEREGKERKGKERKGKEKEKERIGKGIVTIV